MIDNDIVEIEATEEDKSITNCETEKSRSPLALLYVSTVKEKQEEKNSGKAKKNKTTKKPVKIPKRKAEVAKSSRNSNEQKIRDGRQSKVKKSAEIPKKPIYKRLGAKTAGDNLEEKIKEKQTFELQNRKVLLLREHEAYKAVAANNEPQLSVEYIKALGKQIGKNKRKKLLRKLEQQKIERATHEHNEKLLEKLEAKYNGNKEPINTNRLIVNAGTEKQQQQQHIKRKVEKQVNFNCVIIKSTQSEQKHQRGFSNHRQRHIGQPRGPYNCSDRQPPYNRTNWRQGKSYSNRPQQQHQQQ